jgi:hypothetical protein
MWDQGNKGMFGAGGFGQAKSPQGQKKKSAAHYRMKRATGQIRTQGSALTGVPSVTADARIVLNDFSEKGVHLFSSQRFAFDEVVSLTLENPIRFFQKAKVLKCDLVIPSSKIISQDSFKYRITLKFAFDHADQKKSVSAFIKELFEKHLRPANDDDDSLLEATPAAAAAAASSKDAPETKPNAETEVDAAKEAA